MFVRPLSRKSPTNVQQGQRSSWPHWKARSGFLLVLIELSLGVTAEALRAKIDQKSAILLQRGQFDAKFQVARRHPPIVLHG